MTPRAHCPPRAHRLLSVSLLAAALACVAPPSSSSEGGKQSGEGQAQTNPATNPAVTPATPKPAANVPVDHDFDGQPKSTTTLPGGLLVEDFVIGTGEEAKTGAEVSVHYVGTLADGTMFDTSYKRNRPYTFVLGEGRVIKGWDQGVLGMKVGGKRRLTIPAALAYGSRGKGKIPPESTLTFTIELTACKPPLPDPRGDEVFAGEPLRRTELEGGLIIEDFADGEGREAAAGDKVAVHYTGKLDDGTVFDSSVPRKRALSFILGRKMVIQGWETGIAGMKVGGLRRLTVPAELAYGDKARGKIPANARLTFTVELMAIFEEPNKPAAPQVPAHTSPSQPGQPAQPQ